MVRVVLVALGLVVGGCSGGGGAPEPVCAQADPDFDDKIPRCGGGLGEPGWVLRCRAGECVTRFDCDDRDRVYCEPCPDGTVPEPVCEPVPDGGP